MSSAPVTLPRWLLDGPPRLRLPADRDVDRLVEVCSDPDIGRFTMLPVPFRAADAPRLVAWAARQLEEGSGVRLVAVDAEDRVLGMVGLGLGAPYGVGGVGYWVAADARGRGLATAMVRRVVQLAFAELGLARVELEAAASNPASSAVARRAGFAHEGARRSAFVLCATGGRPEQRDDLLVFGLLPSDLAASPVG